MALKFFVNTHMFIKIIKLIGGTILLLVLANYLISIFTTISIFVAALFGHDAVYDQTLYSYLHATSILISFSLVIFLWIQGLKRFIKNIKKDVSTKEFHTFKKITQFLKEKKEITKSWFKNIILILILYLLIRTILSHILRDAYDSADNNFIALTLTILITYVWNKISKRFNL